MTDEATTIEVDFDPGAYSAWEIVEFERVTGMTFMKAVSTVSDGEMDVPAVVLGGLAWLKFKRDQPSKRGEELVADFEAFMRERVTYGDFLSGVSAPDPTPAATPKASPRASKRTSPASARSTAARPKSSAV